MLRTHNGYFNVTAETHLVEELAVNTHQMYINLLHYAYRSQVYRAYSLKAANQSFKKKGFQLRPPPVYRQNVPPLLHSYAGNE